MYPPTHSPTHPQTSDLDDYLWLSLKMGLETNMNVSLVDDNLYEYATVENIHLEGTYQKTK